MKKYTFLIGDNVMYNQTVICRCRWFNPFVTAGLCNIQRTTVLAHNEEQAERKARFNFALKGRFPQLMGVRH